MPLNDRSRLKSNRLDLGFWGRVLLVNASKVLNPLGSSLVIIFEALSLKLTSEFDRGPLSSPKKFLVRVGDIIAFCPTMIS